MAHKKKHTHPVPPGNQPHIGPADGSGEVAGDLDTGRASAQEHDPKRSLGDFTGTGEHSIQQPDGRNGSNH